MANPSIDALNREAEEQSRVYKQLQAETNSLISAQRMVVKALGLQKNSILGSVAHAGIALRESIKTAQLKLQERKVLESQLAANKRSTELQRQNLEHAARLTMSLTGDRKIKAQKIADEYAKAYDIARKKEQSIANQLTQTPSKAAIAFSAGADILKSGVNVVSVAFGALTGTVKSAVSAITSFMNSIKKTQQDFGLTMAQAAKLQADTFMDSAKNMMEVFKTADFTGLGGVITDTFSALFNFGRNISSTMFGETSLGNAGKLLVSQLKNIRGELTKPRELKDFTAEQRAKALTYVGYQERLDAMREVQNEFGMLDKKTSENIARLATQRGISVQQAVQARRVFATQTLGDYNKIEGLQNRFVKVFEGKGMTIKTALESIGKYSELMARNGIRFADSFARAAADAKAIGVDLSKVDQVGDSIIDNFEGFLEKQAELGAMGFNLDANKIAQIAESGDTGALFNELRSQLAATGKDITKLRRSEQLALSQAFGISMSDILRLAGGAPEKTPQEVLQEQNNSLLTNILNVMNPISDVAKALSGPIGVVAAVMGVTSMLGLIYDLLVRGLAALPLIGDTFREELRANYIKNRQAMIEQKMDVGAFSQVFRPKEELTPSKYMPYGRATGGYISGPGTSTSDSIPTMLSNGEYVLPAALVSKIGVSNLDRLRSAVGNADYVRLASALMAGDMKQVVKISADIGVEELVEKIVRRFALGSSALAAGTVMAGKDVYDTYQANKDKPYPTWWSTRTPGEVPKWVQRKKDGGLIKNISGMYDIYKQGGVGGLKSNLLGATGSFLSGKVPGLSSSINAFTQGGVGGLKSNLVNTGLGFLGGKVPGLSGAMSAFSAFKEGGVKGALGSLAKGGIGKAIGGAIGTAIPIPGVGTMIGSVLGSKIGKFAGGLFGKKKGIAAPMGMEAMSSPDLATMMGSQEPVQQTSGPQQAPIVDTSGIEQKLNNFINALQNIQINMDGNQVGKVLVKTSEAAASRAVFRTQAR